MSECLIGVGLSQADLLQVILQALPSLTSARLFYPFAVTSSNSSAVDWSDTVVRLSTILTDAAAKSEENQSAADNAASALGKVVEYQSATAAFDSNQVRRRHTVIHL